MAREAGGGHLTHPAVRREKAVQAPADLVRGGVIRQNPAAEAHWQHMQETGPELVCKIGALWLQTKKAVWSMLAEVAQQIFENSPQRGEDGAASRVARAQTEPEKDESRGIGAWRQCDVMLIKGTGSQ